jgi:hypothetical protein
MWFAFVFAALVFMMIGRQLGWLFSKAFLHRSPIFLSVWGAILWGASVGMAVSGLIGWLHPGTTLRWIMGFALGAYVAIPNYGLFSESTIPDSDLPRHVMIKSVPLLSYVLTEFATRSMR